MLANSRWFSGVWQSTRRRLPLFAFSVVSVLVELWFFGYMVSRGMLDKQVSLPVGGWPVPFSIAVALALGNAVLLVTLWMSLTAGTVYSGLATSDRQVRRILYSLRMLRATAIVLGPFIIILFLPYIVESSWYLGAAGSVANSAPALRGAIEDFYKWAYGLSSVDGATKFVASQVAAGMGTAVIAGLYLWRVRGSSGLGRLVGRRRFVR